jgi:hypothetical protein
MVDVLGFLIILAEYPGIYDPGCAITGGLAAS